MNRIASEKQTVNKMVRLYCRLNHHTQRTLCPDCQELLDYATQRLENCKFGEHKTTCVKCPVHCYCANMRERIKQVMRFSGPRMVIYHPFHLFIYLLRKLK
ncbi:MAG: nitrous oxide-stimulated promoter family protein [Bacteroidaceae bacterium]